MLLREQSSKDLKNNPADGLAKDIYPEVLEKWEPVE